MSFNICFFISLAAVIDLMRPDYKIRIDEFVASVVATTDCATLQWLTQEKYTYSAPAPETVIQELNGTVFNFSEGAM